MGIRLMDKALTEVANGIYTKIPQRQDVDTFEPCTEVKDIYKPDLLMLSQWIHILNFGNVRQYPIMGKQEVRVAPEGNIYASKQ